MARLGEVCKKATSNIAQKDLKGHSGHYPIYGASGFIANVDFYQQENPYIAVVKDGAGIGRIMKLPAKSSVIGTMQYIIPNDTVDITFLAYAMEHMNLSKYFTGATIPHIYFKDYQKEELPLPPLDEQRKIAAVLDKVSDLIAKRRQQLSKLDEMIKARFVEMFGDPENNPMKWPIVKIGTVITTIETGWSGNGKQRNKEVNEIAVLKVSSVTKGYFIPEECKVLNDQKNIKKYVSPQKGDLLFSRANTKEMVGATALIWKDYPDLILPDKLWKIRFVDVANVVYMKYILSSGTIRNKFSSASTGTSGSMYNVSMEKFKAIKIPLPEISKQNQFAAFVEQTEKTKITISRSLEKLETLKKALMQEYFG